MNYHFNMLCSNCNLINTFEYLEFCKPCFDTVMCVSEEVQYASAEMLSPKKETIPEEKQEQDFKEGIDDLEGLGFEQIVAKIRGATTVGEWQAYFKMLDGFIGFTEPMNGIYTCPLCGSLIEIAEMNCKVFRCAIRLNGYVNPHAQLDELLEEKHLGTIIGGCLAPLDLNNSKGLFVPVDKNGNPWYY